MNKVTQDDHDAEEGRVHHEFLGLRGQFVLPLDRLGQVLQDFRQVAGFFAGLDQADENAVEDLGVSGQRLRQGLAAFDAFEQVGHDFAKTRVVEAVAQVGQAFDDRHAGTRKLLEMKAEM